MTVDTKCYAAIDYKHDWNLHLTLGVWPRGDVFCLSLSSSMITCISLIFTRLLLLSSSHSLLACISSCFSLSPSSSSSSGTSWSSERKERWKFFFFLFLLLFIFIKFKWFKIIYFLLFKSWILFLHYHFIESLFV